ARDRHIDFALVVSAAAPRADRTTHPTFQWTSISTRNRISPGPANLASAAFQLPGINLVTQVLLAKLDRVHLDLVSELVDECFHGERRLRMTRRAHRNRGILVRVQRVNLAIRV